MKIALLIATLALGLKFTLIAQASTNEYQEEYCKINLNQC